MLVVVDPTVTSPTIQQFEEEEQVTALSPVFVPTDDETSDQDVPFHCSSTPLAVLDDGMGLGPTAQQAEDDVQVTDPRPSVVGGATADQALPFHCTMKALGVGLLVLELSVPTAQQFEALVQVIASRAVLS
jgi:hypothetical protein